MRYIELLWRDVAKFGFELFELLLQLVFLVDESIDFERLLLAHLLKIKASLTHFARQLEVDEHRWLTTLSKHLPA
jgi:predicted hydrolase (HD superfamily)